MAGKLLIFRLTSLLFSSSVLKCIYVQYARVKIMNYAREAELVDSRDLKSLGRIIRAGSIPALRTKLEQLNRRPCGRFFSL